MGADAVAGQQKLYPTTSRTASVVTETPSVIYRLSAEAPGLAYSTSAPQQWTPTLPQ